MSQRFIHALAVISRKAKKKRIRWVIVGSASVALQGVDVRPHDIDILTTKHGAYAMNAVLRLYEVKAVRFGRSSTFESYFGEFRIRGVKVQVMGDLRVKIRHRWVSLTPRLRRPRIVRVQRLNLPVTPLRSQLVTYKALARRKSRARIRRIERFVAPPRTVNSVRPGLNAFHTRNSL